MPAVVPPSSKDLVPGVAFGSYAVQELIGRGGMASVYRAEHLLLNKPVALKVMDRALISSTPARQRFVLEGRAAASIKHPNVVDITDVGVHDGVPYLVMELLVGEDLETHLRRQGPLDDASAIRLALPIIAALNAAHSSGVVHRDIKPSNIFMAMGPDEQVVPKVLDFGISKVTFDNSRLDLVTTPQNQLIGTPRYLPPEALHGARELGPLSDQYSLGVVLYQCVTGDTPFSGDTLISLLNSLSRGAFEPARTRQPSVSPGLDRVISRALSPDPKDRFPSIRDMGRALLDLAAERTQMVWGHSFRPASQPGDVFSTPRHGAAPPATELIELDGVPRPRRIGRVAVALGLVLTGALAWAIGSGFRAGAEPSLAAQPQTAVRQEALAIRPLVPAEPVSPSGDGSSAAVVPGPSPLAQRTGTGDVRALASGSERTGSAEPAVSRSRLARAQKRVAPVGSARRSEPQQNVRAQETRQRVVAPEPSLSPPVPPRATRTVSNEPPPRARRQGANRSPLLD